MKTKQLKSLVVGCALAVVLVLLTVRLVSAGPELGLAESQGTTAPPLSSAKSGLAAPLPQAGGALTVTLQAASGATELFWTENGDVDAGAVSSTIPHLILYENGGLTPPISRTLFVTVSDIEVPLSGVTVTSQPETCTLANLPLANLHQEVTR